MPHPSKQKGNRLERLVVRTLESFGCESRRAWGSDGRSLGEHEEVDVLTTINGRKWKLQVKARKRIAEWIKPNIDVVDAQVIKEDRGELLVVMPLEKFVKEVLDARQ